MARNNENLSKARENKNDEFYTRFNDIQNELNWYHEYDENFLKGKTVLLPCDDSQWSNFTKFFAMNFKRYGIKKLISTAYGVEGGKGKLFIMEGDTNNDGRYNELDMTPTDLEGDGDFRSEEVTKLRDQADVIITNPPFSLFRDFVKWIMEGKKQFLIVGNMNAITYKDIFTHIKNGDMWLGKTAPKYFLVPERYERLPEYEGKIIEIDGKSVKKFGNILWFTNIEHGRKKRVYTDGCLTMAQCLKHNKKLIKLGQKEYYKYDNYDAIEVPELKAIPSDYMGVMGVPITFLGVHNPLEFEIVGLGAGKLYNMIKDCKGLSKDFVEDYYSNGGKGSYVENHPILGYYNKDNKAIIPYMRILIKRK